jgi:hypothetical protein
MHKDPADNLKLPAGPFALLPLQRSTNPHASASFRLRGDFRAAVLPRVRFRLDGTSIARRNHQPFLAFVLRRVREGGMRMKKTLAVLATVGTVATSAMAPAPAEAHGIGPGVAFGLAAGALTAGAIAASHPYYYGYGYGPGYYGYYGRPAYAYYGGPYTYYRPHYYHRHYWRHW